MENETPKCVKCGSKRFSVIVKQEVNVCEIGSDVDYESIQEAQCKNCHKEYSAEELQDLDWIDQFWNIIGE